MICKYCGKELVEGSKFCEECGKEVVVEEQAPQEPEVKEEVVAEEQLAEETTPETPEEPEVVAETPVSEEVPQEPVFAQPEFEAPVKKGKKKKVLAVLIPVIAVLVALAIVATMFFNVIKGFFVKTFGSDEDYFKFVETKAFGSVTDDFSEFYGEFLAVKPNSETAISETIDLNVSDTVIDLLEEAIEDGTGEAIDLAWLDTVSFDLDVKAKNNIEQMLAAVNINGKEFLDMDFIMDMDKGEVFVAFLSLSDKYLKGEFSTNEETQQLMDILYDEDLRKALPEQDKLDKLLDKYIEVIFENIDDVEKSSDVVEVGDVEQKLTVLEAEIDQEDALDIASAVLKTAKKDKELKEYIKDVAKYLEKKELISDSDMVYDSFKNYIEESIDAIDGTEIDDEDDSSIVWIDYINSKHEVVGRKLKADSNEIASYVLVRDGNKFAFELECQGVKLSGEGTEKKDVVNATFTVKNGETEICDIAYIDCKTNADYPNGKIRISPSEDLMEELDLDSSIVSALSIANPSIEFNIEGGEKSGKMEINIVSGEEVLVGLTATFKEEKPSNIKKPDSSDVYEKDEVDEWASEIDVQDLLDKLDEIGISTDFIGSLMAPSYEDDYDYDYDFDYAPEDAFADEYNDSDYYF